MGSLNKVQLIGNLGRDIDLRYTQSGTAVGTVNIATTDTWTDKAGQKQERTEWHRIVIWGKSAESLAEYLKKGKQIYVEGQLQTREWEDKDGIKRYTTEIRSQRVVLLGGGGGRRNEPPTPSEDDFGQAQSEPAMAAAPSGAPAYDDDIPF